MLVLWAYEWPPLDRWGGRVSVDVAVNNVKLSNPWIVKNELAPLTLKLSIWCVVTVWLCVCMCVLYHLWCLYVYKFVGVHSQGAAAYHSQASVPGGSDSSPCLKPNHSRGSPNCSQQSHTNACQWAYPAVHSGEAETVSYFWCCEFYETKKVCFHQWKPRLLITCSSLIIMQFSIENF